MKRTAFHYGRQLLAVVMVVVLVALSACAAKPTPTPPKTTPPPASPIILEKLSPLPITKAPIIPPKPEGPPTLMVEVPTEGQKIYSAKIGVQLIITNFNYLTASPKENYPGMGKVCVYLDVEPPTKPGASGLTAKGTYMVGNTDGFAVWGKTDISPGKHTVYVQLLNNDDTPLDPPVVAKVNVTLDYVVTVPPTLTGAPGCQISAPAEGAVISSPNFLVTVKLINFSAMVLIGPPKNYSHAGRVIGYLNIEPLTEKGKTALTKTGTYRVGITEGHTDTVTLDWTDVKAGKHTVYVQLVNYDNTPLDPPVVSKVNFELKY